MISSRPITAIVVATILGAGGVATAAATTLKGAEFAGQAKVSLARARATALAARPGHIIDQELEKEAGGSGLRYSFDVRSQGRTVEVGVDAATGKVLENAAESAAAEAREAGAR